MTDAEKFQFHLDHFAGLLEACATILRCGESATVDSLRSATSRWPQEDETACRLRCEKALRAYAYIFKHEQAFKNIDAIQVDTTGRTSLNGRLVFALYLFFGGELYLTSEPQLELVLDASIKAEESEGKA